MPQHVVVDGSNIATEGRSNPSLAQLDEAVRAYLAEHPDAQITVVVDATFGHRIDEKERRMFEEARAAGEVVSPPAGAIGRGDAFLLRIAEKTGALVLSNDSFQEFHGEHGWLFDQGRLLGGVPVAGVGWIFTFRTPVRGPKSRDAVKAARRGRQPVANRPSVVAKAIADATDEVVEPGDGTRRRRRRRTPSTGAPSDPVNEPLPFIEFVSAHRLGTEVEGEVEAFTSHGAFVMVGALRCYVPLSAMGNPPPRSARDVMTKGEVRTFVVQALDPPRRGVELAMPGFVHVAGGPTDETVDAEIHADDGRSKAERKAAARQEAEDRARAAAEEARLALVGAEGGPAEATPAKKTSRRAKKAAPVAEAAAVEPVPASVKKAPAKKAATAKAPAKKAAAAKAPAKKAAGAKAPAKKAAAAKTPARKAPAKKAAKKAVATKAPAKKAAVKAPAKKATAPKAPTAKAPAKKAPAKKAPAKAAKKA